MNGASGVLENVTCRVVGDIERIHEGKRLRLRMEEENAKALQALLKTAMLRIARVNPYNI